MVEITDLPPEVLELLFKFLDSQSIRFVSETCTKFSDVVANSENLTKKLTLHLRFPQDLQTFAEAIYHTNRRYRSLCIVRCRDRITDINDPDLSSRIFSRLGGMIKELKIDWSNAMRPREPSVFDIMVRRRSAAMARVRGAANIDNFDEGIAAQAPVNIREDIYNEFVFILRHFTNVSTLFLFNVHLERGRLPNEPSLMHPQLRELTVRQCDSFCFDLLSTCKRLEKIEVADPWWNQRTPGINTFETFLINQTELKHLQLKNFQYPRLFQADREFNFRLKSLVLKNVYFADKEIANNFFRTQNELESVDLQLHNEKVRCLDEMQWYSTILRTIVSSSHLKSLTIAKLRYKIENYQFLSNILNQNVKKLIFKVTAEDKSSELFKTFIKMFPNLEVVSFNADESEETDSGICFEDGTVLEKVNSLSIKNSSVRSLVNVFAGSLQSFEYVPGKTGEFIDDLFGGFFHRHRNIKHLVIGSGSERSYFFVSFNLCQLIVSFLAHLESITIYNFGEVNKSVKLLCNLPKLKSLKLSAEDYQQFTAKTKVECARNGLKLIPFKIPTVQTLPPFVVSNVPVE